MDGRVMIVYSADFDGDTILRWLCQTLHPSLNRETFIGKVVALEVVWEERY